MVLDFMPPINSSYDSVEKSLVLTHRWAEEALRKHSLLRKENVIEIKDKSRVMKYNVNNKNQLLFAISQGGLHKELRMKSAEYLSSLKINGREFDGIAIGGLAIGEKQKDMLNMIESATSKIPKNKIRYLMGVGNPLDIIEAVERGIDAFDSIYPTRNARHGTIFTWKGKIDLMSGKYSNDFSPIEEGCKCDTCKRYTKAYLHHLLKINEPIGKKYVQHHNIYFMLDFMRKIRESIKNDKFREFKREFIKMWSKNKT
jgi:queuine tRNA-ribosyltransferase